MTVNWTEEQLKEKMKEYSAKADDTGNSYFDRDVYRQMYYYYKTLLLEKQDETDRINNPGNKNGNSSQHIQE
jgi:uncharacterized membrane protein YvbJ